MKTLFARPKLIARIGAERRLMHGDFWPSKTGINITFPIRGSEGSELTILLVHCGFS